jgi:hypothetical protein
METPARQSRGHHAKELGRNCKVTEGMESGRSDQKIARLYVLLTARRGQFLLVLAIVLLAVGGAIAGYIFGLNLTYRDLAATRVRIQQLEPENQRLKKAIIDENAKLGQVQGELASVQAALHAIMPSENTYSINPNQSLIVAGGHLIIGLIGPPTIDGVKINVNGKQQMATTGDVIHIALDSTTTCQVGVQSFDMFKAVLTASCAGVKPQ